MATKSEVPITKNHSGEQSFEKDGEQKLSQMIRKRSVLLSPSDVTNMSSMDSMSSKKRLSGRYALNKFSLRQLLSKKLRVLADIALGFAILDIILIVVEQELVWTNVIEKGSQQSFTFHALVTISTIGILVSVVYYYVLDIKLFMTDNSIDDWRIALNLRRAIQLATEIVICFSPIPPVWYFQLQIAGLDPQEFANSKASMDIFVSIFMFLRLYLTLRVIVLHSPLSTDASSRSIGAINKISINTKFALKTLMTLSPGTVLVVFIGSFWLIASWIVRLCERNQHEKRCSEEDFQGLNYQVNYTNYFWFVAITFLTVGYGDVVPITSCGRIVALLTGIMGVGISSLVVAVVARQMELSGPEKHVHIFMQDRRLVKEMRQAAANVLRETWLIYKHKSKKAHSAVTRRHQRMLILAIYKLRSIRTEQRALAENSDTISDIARTASLTYELITEAHSRKNQADKKLLTIENQVRIIEAQIHALPDAIVERIRSNDINSSVYSQLPGQVVSNTN